MPKAMIAGYRGYTGAEFLFFGLKKAEDVLRTRSECIRAIVVIHDGQPVANWKKGRKVVRNWNRSHERMRGLEMRGIPVIGIYLGDKKNNIEKTQELTLRLAICLSKELTDKLGNLLMSLA